MPLPILPTIDVEREPKRTPASDPFGPYLGPQAPEGRVQRWIVKAVPSVSSSDFGREPSLGPMAVSTLLTDHLTNAV